VVCQHCQERYCTECPEDGIEIGPLGQVMVSEELCTACGMCEIYCPIGAIELYDDVPYVCDLCDGNPHCVAACTMNAIHYDPELSGKVSLEPFNENADKLGSEEKRIRYATQSTRELRDRWISERKV
jgi:Fe-S-cluster-containing hydrogenase component 2